MSPTDGVPLTGGRPLLTVVRVSLDLVSPSVSHRAEVSVRCNKKDYRDVSDAKNLEGSQDCVREKSDQQT